MAPYVEVCILVSTYMGYMETAFTVNPKPFKKDSFESGN